ncbi:MAG TPA: dihydrolipoamide acetyltransferase family protein [Polyangiaceae bacterium]|nr:dihydrolipoamide acetyltransferase family protein [Polyangiaceae bacterium]
MAEFRMPSLGADMDAGTLVEWLKKPGDRVSRGDIIAEVETEKGIIEVEVFTSGVVERFLVEPGTKVPVGTALAILQEDGATPAAPAPSAAPAPAPSRTDAAPVPVPPTPAPAKPEAPPRISPAARKRAAELGVDPASVAGTGPGGAVTLEDVEGAVPRAPEDARSRMRHAIAAAMARSKREIPHYYVNHTVDVTPLLSWIERFNEAAQVPDRIIPGVAFLKSVALALREFPAFNGFWMDGRATPSSGIHVGAAVALRGGGLVAPAIRDTDRLSLVELMHAFRDLVARARASGLRSSEMSDPTITVTSLGDRGTESVLGVIYPPQLAIVGFGRILLRPWVVDGAVAPRSVVHLSLAADHRATDGHEGALFLARIAENLEKPEAL